MTATTTVTSTTRQVNNKHSWRDLAEMDLDALETLNGDGSDDWMEEKPGTDEWGLSLESKRGKDIRSKLRRNLKSKSSSSKAGLALVVLLSFVGVAAVVDTAFSTPPPNLRSSASTTIGSAAIAAAKEEEEAQELTEMKAFSRRLDTALDTGLDSPVQADLFSSRISSVSRRLGEIIPIGETRLALASLASGRSLRGGRRLEGPSFYQKSVQRLTLESLASRRLEATAPSFYRSGMVRLAPESRA